jgi:alpha-mannosidase
MRKRWWILVALVGLGVGLLPAGIAGQGNRTSLYLIATAHMDSQWNWTVQDTIRDYVPKTFHTNFDYFEKYPNYKFSWEGAGQAKEIVPTSSLFHAKDKDADKE